MVICSHTLYNLNCAVKGCEITSLFSNLALAKLKRILNFLNIKPNLPEGKIMLFQSSFFSELKTVLLLTHTLGTLK